MEKMTRRTSRRWEPRCTWPCANRRCNEIGGRGGAKDSGYEMADGHGFKKGKEKKRDVVVETHRPVRRQRRTEMTE